MVSIKSALLLWVISAAHAATFYEKQVAALKRAVDQYQYPQPIITFPEQPKKTVVETMKSVSPSLSQGRYLPPGPTAPSAPNQNSPPISVSFNAYEAPAAPAQNTPPSTAAPAAPAAPASSVTVQKKRPTGGLGGFKYYGGSGSSSSSSKTVSNEAATATVSAPAPAAAPAPVAPVKVEPTPEKPVQKQAGKTAGYDYPSPKSNRKPSKKEQKLADSKPEESAQGYHYDVGPEAIAGGSLAGVQQTFSAGPAAMGMGLSYMRQSSPYYSYHVMLD